MHEGYEVKKYASRKHIYVQAASKVTLFSLLVIGLLIAHLIIASRSALVLSGPIKLEHVDLSVSMPAGNGWQSESQWRYQENNFCLSSVFIPGSDNLTTMANCRYLLAPPTTDPNTQFTQRASALGGAIEKTGKMQIDKLVVAWAHIAKKPTLEMFFGTVQLPNRRHLEIEVFQSAGRAELAERVFRRILESLKFKDSPLLEAGSEIIAEIKSLGLASFLNNQTNESFFLIRDVQNRTIGFSMDIIINTHTDTLNIQAAGYLYARGLHAQEQVAFFQSNNKFDQFSSKSETSKPGSEFGVELAMDKSGLLTVRKLAPETEEKTCRPGPAALPEALLELFLGKMLESRHEQVMVDVIKTDGTITPTIISKIEVDKAAAGESEAVYALKAEFLDGLGFSEQIFFDNQKQVSKTLLRQREIYTVERTSAKNIIKEFPERADYILQKNKLLKKD